MYRLIPKSKPRPKQTKCLLPRLRWPIFGNLSDIEVEIGMDEQGQPVRTQLFEHSIAAQPVSEPPASKLWIRSIDVLQITRSEEFEVESVNKDFEYKELLIDTKDGSPITIGEFVAQVHEHLNKFRRIIIEFKCLGIHGTFDDARLAQLGVSKDDFKVYFEYIISHSVVDKDVMSWGLVTYAEGEYGDMTLEEVLRTAKEQT
jgi:hypothetical protein